MPRAPCASISIGGRPSAAVAAGLALALRDAAVVCCGDASLDRGTGAVPAFLAGELGAEQALGLVGLHLPEPDDAGPPRLRAERRLDRGRREHLVVSLPCVVSVEAHTARLRRAPLDRVLASHDAPVELTTAQAPARLLAGSLAGALSGGDVEDHEASGGAAPVRTAPFRPRPRVVPAPASSLPGTRARALPPRRAGRTGAGPNAATYPRSMPPPCCSRRSTPGASFRDTMTGMQGPVAIVTGAARGIGAATAILLASEGWKIVLVDACADIPGAGYAMATRAELDGTVAACGEAIGVISDVRDQVGLDMAVAEAVDRYGGLDAAVACAGVVAGGPNAWDLEEATWETLLAVNLTGVWRLARAAVPELLRRPVPRRGRFVAVASAGGSVGLPRLAGYAAAKHGVVGLVRSLAAELGPEGVTANAVAPGSTRTAALDASAVVYGLEDPEAFRLHHLDQRLLEPGEIAAAIGFLCSEAASGITGAVLPVDAGMTAR